MHKISRLIALILGVIGLVLCGWLMVSSDETKNSIDNFPMIGMFGVAYLLLFIGLVVVILSASKNILSSPKSIKKTLLYAGAFLGVIIVSYPLSYVLFGSDSNFQWISAGIMATYLLILISLVSVVFSVIKRT